MFGLPLPALIAVAILAIAYVVFEETRFGRYVTGIGANAEAVRRAGVDIRRTTLLVYVLSVDRGGARRHHPDRAGSARDRPMPGSASSST